jgi:hypothetical protein
VLGFTVANEAATSASLPVSSEAVNAGGGGVDPVVFASSGAVGFIFFVSDSAVAAAFKERLST